MKSRLLIWCIPAIAYAVFYFWYTGTGGPLSEEEIGRLVASMTANNFNADEITIIEEFARTDTGSQVLMLNAIDMNESPPDVEGAKPGESAQQLMGRYMEHMFPAMLKRACHPVILGAAVAPSVDMIGIEGAEIWDVGALFRYRSRRDLIEIISNPAFAGKHAFKTAALTKTIAYPIEPRLYLGDPRLLLGLALLALVALIDNWRLSRQGSKYK